MKLIKAVIVMLILTSSTNVLAQKVKLKKGNVLVDGEQWLTYQDCGMFDGICSLYNSSEEEIIFIKLVKVPGEEARTQSNPDGNLTYNEVIFLGKDLKYEIRGRTYKGIISDLFNAKVVNEDGSLNDERIDRLIEKLGTPYSDRLNNSTIIIKESDNNSGSGVNIKIGN
ncbi:hypothetical protein C1T31_01010 [Hanstruepera neustonica]|uniref:Uncharacterized protein n=1 Tax=Hanstruepera neustonica TaxID=1445657 RepID=A0A2K1E394_9FLAO|nr:hypothetical protein [Hanstruepera neustonica]PNQ74752.1 hypothetical protein C1T31_01010 [Hanstruepera neustonica]